MASDLLTDFELMVLLSILTVEGRAHGAAIAREMRQRGGCRVVPREVHATLDRLERDELVAPAVRDPTSSRRSGTRPILEVTPAGLRAVESKQRALVALWAGLPELKDEPLVGELVGEYGARRSQVWLWYLATRVQTAFESDSRSRHGS